VQPPVQAAPTPTYQPPAPTYQPIQAPPTAMYQQAAPTQPAQNIQPPMPQPSQVIGVIALKRPKNFGRWDSYTGVITIQQFIIAQMTSDMIKDAAMQARDQAKSDGKGFWGQWSEQLKASFGYTKRYLNMTPQAIIAETPGNFAIDNNTITEIKLKRKHINNDYDSVRYEWEVEIHSLSGKYEFKMDDNSEFVELLKKVYPDRTKTPLGYSSRGINIKLF
jgi:hypothetical protein